MKRNLAIFGVILTLLTAALFFAKYRRQQSPVYILNQYPKTPVFNQMLREHMNSPDKEEIILADWFDPIKSEHVSIIALVSCSIYQNKSKYTSIEFDNGSSGEYSDVTSDEVVAIKKATFDLPPSAPNPTLDNLFVVSFWENRTWATRIYDRSNLPPQVVKIRQILGLSDLSKSPISEIK